MNTEESKNPEKLKIFKIQVATSSCRNFFTEYEDLKIIFNLNLLLGDELTFLSFLDQAFFK